MDNLIVALNVVLPLFLCMALGYFLKRIHFYDDHVLDAMNRLVFRVFLPILLFRNLYNTDMGEVFNPKLILFAAGAIVFLFVLLILIVPLFEKDNAKRGVMAQAILRSNYVLYGIPIVSNLCGEDNIGAASLLVAVCVPILNVLGVVCLEIFRGNQPDFKGIFKGIITNPLIIASLLGVAACVSGLKLPGVIEETMEDLSGVASPLSLVVLGGFFTMKTVHGNLRQIVIGTTGRLILVPLLMISLAVLSGFRDEELAAIMILFASPTAVASFTMAKQMGGDADLAAQLVIVMTAVSIVTIFLWIFCLTSFGLI